ncbi:MAG: hypothetical protein CMD14_08465 [Flavobacteriales bacterium]|nr:hypothetical protein [Flavobacteriales bacterium]
MLAQQTYVPDDVFEKYIETYFPAANNGVVNDDSVLTAGLNLPSSSPIILDLNPATLSSPFINDFTGIEDFIGLRKIVIENLNNTTIDLSQAILTNGNLNFLAATIAIGSCPLLTNLILPSDTIQLNLTSNTYLTNIVFQPLTFIGNSVGLEGLVISGCNSLTNIDISNIAGVFNGSMLSIFNNLNLTQLNLKNGFCYNWGLVDLSGQNLFCIQVDDPNYSSISSNWSWYERTQYPSQYSYSTNCSWSTYFEEHSTNKKLLKVTDLLGKETKVKKNEPLLYLYDDGTVEKRITID